MKTTPRSLRLHIGVFGRRNVGKSALLNALTGQTVSIVSEFAGTTTDPVEKPMELQPIGPVVFIDTAGIDDTGLLGEKRVEATYAVFDRTDLAIVVALANDFGGYEEALLEALSARKIPVVVVFNKMDIALPTEDLLATLKQRGLPVVVTNATSGDGLALLRTALIERSPDAFIDAPSLLADLLPKGSLVVLVVPVDKEAPRGRLILPQVQAIRALLDHDSFCLVVKERELSSALSFLNRKPSLVVTDSQAFTKVAADTPEDVLITSFSILFARFKGDLETLVKGAMAIDTLKKGDRVLIAEACTHHPIEEDIGKVKIPNWMNRFVGGPLEYGYVRGHDFPRDLSSYKLVVHCGACTITRREMLTRIWRCREAGVPVTNYGMTIAYSLGIFSRALRAFPELRREEMRVEPIKA